MPQSELLGEPVCAVCFPVVALKIRYGRDMTVRGFSSADPDEEMFQHSLKTPCPQCHEPCFVPDREARMRDSGTLFGATIVLVALCTAIGLVYQHFGTPTLRAFLSAGALATGAIGWILAARPDRYIANRKLGHRSGWTIFGFAVATLSFLCFTTLPLLFP